MTSALAITFDIGDQPVYTAEVRDLAGALADPTSIEFRYRREGAAVTTYTAASPEVEHPTPGVFRLTLPVLAVAGRHYVRCAVTGAVQAAGEATFTVDPTHFP